MADKFYRLAADNSFEGGENSGRGKKDKNKK